MSHVADFGAYPDGSDAYPGIAAAIAAENVVELDAGTYTLASGANSLYALSLPARNGIKLKGQGKGLTKLKQTASRGVLASAAGCNGLVIEGITFDGNRTNSTSQGKHGLRIGSGQGITLRDVGVVNAWGYGIGFQDGNYQDLLVEDFRIEESCLDGLDIKNNGNLNARIRILNGAVINAGADTAASSPAAIDVRGPGTIVSGIHTTVTVSGRNTVGIRLRQDDATQGEGGKYSLVSNCHHHGQTGNFGFYNAAPNAAYAHCSAFMAGGAGHGFFLAGTGLDVLVTGCQSIDGGRGFWTQGQRVHFVNCISADHANEGFRLDACADNTFAACYSRANGYGFRSVNSPSGNVFTPDTTAIGNITNWAV